MRMLSLLVIAVVAFLASGLTLYSGFGLGTVLLPAFALFFPVPVAVAATGVVHLANNLFKGTLLRRAVDWNTVLRFGLPAIPGAILGAWLLTWLGTTPPVFEWRLGTKTFAPTGAGIAVGALMLVFAALEFQAWFQRLAAPRSFLPLGGVLTGFLGGFTGQQGALRSLFLLKTGLAPVHFIATGVFIAILIDLSRIPTYLAAFSQDGLYLGESELLHVAVGTLAAFLGAYLGVRLLKKTTIGIVRAAVAVLMLLIGAALILGVVGT